MLRLHSWRPATPLHASDPLAYSLHTHMLALRPLTEELRLLTPERSVALPCRSAADEPTFSWSVPLARDPGPSEFAFVAVRSPREGPGAGAVLVRQLDESVLQRKIDGDRAVYSWRPSVRSQKLRERELVWEYEDIAPRGTSFTWTITGRQRNGVILMDAPRSVTVLR